jgi:hypothetical protein
MLGVQFEQLPPPAADRGRAATAEDGRPCTDEVRIDRHARRTFDSFSIVKQIVDAKVEFGSLPEAVGRHRHQYRTADGRRPLGPRRP